MAATRTKRGIGALLALAGLGAAILALRPPSPPSTPTSPPRAPTSHAAKPAASARGSSAKPKRRAQAAPGAPKPGQADRRPEPREVLVRAAWGSAPGELGRSRPREGAPEAPMGFAPDARGRLHVLDQVNSRLQIFEKGKPTATVPLPSDTYQDIALLPNGDTVVLDRLVTKTLGFIDERGAITHTVPVVGPGVPEGGGVTGLFTRPDGVWLEVEHGSLVRAALADGTPDPARSAVAGRLSPDGRSVVRAALRRPLSTVVTSEPLAADGTSFTATISFPIPVFALHALELDGAGRIYLAANLVREGDAPTFEVLEEREIVVVLGRDGAEIGRVEIAPPQGPEEQFRPIRIGDDGSIYQLVAGEDAATIERYSL